MSAAKHSTSMRNKQTYIINCLVYQFFIIILIISTITKKYSHTINISSAFNL